MTNRYSGLHYHAVRSVAAILCTAVWTAQAASSNGVLLTGYNVQYGEDAAAVSDSALGRHQLCGAEGTASMLNLLNQIGDRLEGRLAQGGISPSARQQEAEAARRELCQTGDAFSVDAYAMTYADCRLTMDTASVLTDISLPTGEASAVMSVSDFYRAESNRMALDRTLEGAGGAGFTTGDVEWTGPGDNRQIAGYSTTRWDFQYEGGMNMGSGSMAGLEALGLDASFTSTGHGYYSTSAPGIEIVQAFFNNFASEIRSGSGSSMFGGMLNTMVNMLQKGMPLQMEQTVTTGTGSISRGGMRTMMKATGLRTVTMADDFCTRSLVPDYFAVTDMSRQLEGVDTGMGAPDGGAASGGTAGPSDLEQAMGEFNKMLEQMTPEQREAMKGLEGMFGGAAIADPAGQPSLQAPAAAAPSSAASGLPSSSDLMTGDVTQSVQNHLRALGYDPGNRSGELSTQTVIAISQFQAEKGMEVTGEVSPQLLGILAAEVDSQR